MTDGPTGITATQLYALSWQAFAATRDWEMLTLPA